MKKTITLCMIIFLSAGMMKAQEKSTMNVKDLNSNIEKYVKKAYPDYKIVEAFKYDVVYGMKLQKGEEVVGLVFDSKAKFKTKLTEAEKAKYTLQTRTTMSLDDVSGDITKYAKKNYPDYKLTEAFKFDEVYNVKITKANATEMLLFNKDGKYIKKTTPAGAATATSPETEMKEAPADSVKP